MRAPVRSNMLNMPKSATGCMTYNDTSAGLFISVSTAIAYTSDTVYFFYRQSIGFPPKLLCQQCPNSNCRLLDNFDNKGRKVCSKVSLYKKLSAAKLYRNQLPFEWYQYIGMG